jgi:hypothetical protein
MLRTIRWVALAFLAAAGAAFMVSLLRQQRLGRRSGYEPPVSPEGPDAVAPGSTILLDDAKALVAH